MILMLLRFCVSIYATPDHTVDPVAEVCVDYERPVAYDVALCLGEVTSWEDDLSTGMCELTLGGE